MSIEMQVENIAGAAEVYEIVEMSLVDPDIIMLANTHRRESIIIIVLDRRRDREADLDTLPETTENDAKRVSAALAIEKARGPDPLVVPMHPGLDTIDPLTMNPPGAPRPMMTPRASVPRLTMTRRAPAPRPMMTPGVAARAVPGAKTNNPRAINRIARPTLLLFINSRNAVSSTLISSYRTKPTLTCGPA